MLIMLEHLKIVLQLLHYIADFCWLSSAALQKKPLRRKPERIRNLYFLFKTDF
jgi:hypothetical protein